MFGPASKETIESYYRIPIFKGVSSSPFLSCDVNFALLWGRVQIYAFGRFRRTAGQLSYSRQPFCRVIPCLCAQV